MLWRLRPSIGRDDVAQRAVPESIANASRQND